MTNTPLPDHETIEKAFKAPAEILDALPKTTESDRARYHVGEGYRYAREARERAKADRTEDVAGPDASVSLRGSDTSNNVSLRGPAMLRMPLAGRMTSWRRSDGSAP